MACVQSLDDCEITLLLFDIYNYIGNCKRPMVEGEALLSGKHIVLCGITERCERFVKIFGLCLQSSNLDGPPHEINIRITVDKDIECSCSCKAGMSGKCKHIVAVLLYSNSDFSRSQQMVPKDTDTT